MKLKNITEIEDFIDAVDSCKRNVWLESPEGDKYNLKSKFSQYLGLAALLSEKGEFLELYCDKEDTSRFFKFFNEHPESI